MLYCRGTAIIYKATDVDSKATDEIKMEMVLISVSKKAFFFLYWINDIYVSTLMRQKRLQWQWQLFYDQQNPFLISIDCVQQS